MKIFTKPAEIILNLLFPPRCSFCSEVISCIPVPEYYLCESCLSQVLFIGIEACRYCGKRLRDREEIICGQCVEQRYYSKVISACEYSGLVREKILEYKFDGSRQLHKVFSEVIINKLKMTNDQQFDIIISVPVHMSKLQERGYNQSELIAKEIAKYFLVQISIDNLIKIKPTMSQSKLHRKDRLSNLAGSFQVTNNQDILGKKILLVDDIITTGSTANECSKVLMQAGAKDITVVTIATGKNDMD